MTSDEQRVIDELIRDRQVRSGTGNNFSFTIPNFHETPEVTGESSPIYHAEVTVIIKGGTLEDQRIKLTIHDVELKAIGDLGMRIYDEESQESDEYGEYDDILVRLDPDQLLELSVNGRLSEVQDMGHLFKVELLNG